MKILAYCYGPISDEKEFFCKQFIKENKDYEIVSSQDIRQKLTNEIFVKNKETEKSVVMPNNRE